LLNRGSLRAQSPWLVALGGALWLVLLLVGFKFLWAYELTPGQAALSGPAWPSNSVVQLDGQRANLLVFAHPRCPCTRATITELEQIILHSRDRIKVTVFFYMPSDETADWPHTGIWDAASHLPGVTVRADKDGQMARLFGAQTSGQVLLYDAHGQQIFSGGITSARGHVGDNLGRDNIIALTLGEFALTNKTTVYGCSLLAPSESTKERP